MANTETELLDYGIFVRTAPVKPDVLVDCGCTAARRHVRRD